jgi:heterodisulfide reductase subunit B
MTKVPYYPGCTLNTVASSFDRSARECAHTLGFELDELSQWNCCGASFPLTPDNLMGLTAPAKILHNAAKQGDVVTTLCSFCYNVLKRTDKALDDQEKRAIVFDFIEEEYDKKVEVKHFIEIIKEDVGYEKLKEKVVKQLTGMKVSNYYGCMLLRPSDEVGIDDPESPMIFEDFLKSLGCKVIDFPNKIDCCGAHLSVSEEGVVEKMSGTVLRSAQERGAEALVTSCPLCLYNLEKSQAGAAKDDPSYKEMPIFYFTQILGLALGHDIDTLEFDRNGHDPRPFLKERGLI